MAFQEFVLWWKKHDIYFQFVEYDPKWRGPFKRNEKLPLLTTDKRMCATIFIAIPSLSTTHGRNPSFEDKSTLLSVLLKFEKIFFFGQQFHHFN